MNWKEELKQLHLAHIKRTSPSGFELSGGNKMKLKPYNALTTNGLTNCVYSWLRFSLHWVNRINSTGVARRINGKLTYTNSSTNRGTADLSTIIKNAAGVPVPIMIEIKNQNTRDKMSKYQHKEQANIEASGGLYIVITNMESFVNWYKSFTAKEVNLL